jgi:small subunit ribosomal protein S16
MLAVKIRMKRMGSKKRPFFRIVAADSRSPRDGRFIESLGYYNPVPDPPEINFDEDKVYKWLDNGAKPTKNAAQILRQAGLLERWQLLKQGVKIHELSAKIEERRTKQPVSHPKAEIVPSGEDSAVTESEEQGETEEQPQEKKPLEKETEGEKSEEGKPHGKRSHLSETDAKSVSEDEGAGDKKT